MSLTITFWRLKTLLSETKRSQTIPVTIAGITGWAHDGYALVLVSLLVTSIQGHFGVSNAEVGFVMSGQYIMTVFGAAFFGELADRFGRKNVLLISVLWDSILTAMSAFAPNFLVFALLRLISGLGVSWGISFSLLSENFSPEKRGRAGGLVHATFVLGYIGAVIATLILEPKSITLGGLIIHGWQLCFLTALFPIPFLIYLEFSLSESQMWSDYQAEQKKEEEIVQPEKIRLFDMIQGKWLRYTILLTMLFWFSVFAYHCLADWAPTYLEYVFTAETGDVEASKTTARIIMLGVMVVAFFALFLTGWASDYIGRQKAFILCSVIGLVGVTVFAAGNFLVFAPVIILPSLIILTSSFGVHGVFGVWASETFPTRMRASATSIIFSVARGLALGAFIVGIISESLRPAIPDPVADAKALAFGMSLCIFAYIAMLIVPKLIPETRGRDISKIEEAV
ncbi:MAG: MFS transporter [Candidatus Odinarchaeota archaeon]